MTGISKKIIADPPEPSQPQPIEMSCFPVNRLFFNRGTFCILFREAIRAGAFP